MVVLEWSDEFSVGIDLIDKQHKILIRAINLLAMAVEYNSSRELMREIFVTLRDYTDTHFAYEEELFDRFSYPETDKHKAEHRSLLSQVVNLEQRWKTGEAEIGPEVLKFLVNWLRTHILGSDKKYSDFLIRALGHA
ncbi:MAG: hemerythrin family protein [Hyphomicrobiaceae bacterium]|nr:hemerythrin family protein [Hyphomicrobiaceae bacterium]